MHEAKGVVSYSDAKGEFRLTAEVDPAVADFYRAMIPKSYGVQKSRWPAHITVVRPGKEVPERMEHWNKYAGEVVQLEYDTYIREAKGYFWLDFFSTRLEDIRMELGLPLAKPGIDPPRNRRYFKTFHMTVANNRHKI